MEINMNENITINILNSMSECLNQDQLSKLKNVLYMNFSSCNIIKEQHELCVSDNRNLQYLKEFAQTKKLEGRSNKTIEMYINQNRTMLEYIQKDVNDITTKDLRGYMAWMQDTKNLKNVTLENMRHYYSSFFNWLEDEEYILKSPTRKLKPIKQEKLIKKPFSDEDLVKIKEESRKHPRDIALVEFLNSTGCRVSEVAKLNISDVNFETSTVIVYGKGNKERKVYIVDSAMYYLKNYIKSIGKNADDISPLFCSKKLVDQKIRLGKEGIESLMRTIGQRSGVAQVYPHRFRRTLACRLINRSVPIQEVMKILGHEKIDTTMLYCNIDDCNVQLSHKKYA